MDKDIVLRVEGLGKKFCRTLKRSLFYGTVDIARSMIGVDYRTDYLRPAEFWALDDISFELRRGETLGLIGQNGCGKSTLLRIINGIFPPDKGRIDIKGRIGALIAVGAGFHPHMTGRENIYLNGTILGMTRKEIDSKLEEIVDFAEIGEFINSPVATYSSGMTVRLGFAIAIHCEPDILLLDEILAVGDGRFQQKCFSKMAKMLKGGTAVIFVSHNMQLVQMLCKKAAFMDQGKFIEYGKVEDIVGFYYNKCAVNVFEGSEKPKEEFISTYNISYEYLRFFNDKGEETRTFQSGEDIIAEWKFKMDGEITNVSIYFGMANDGFTFSGYTTAEGYDNYEIEKINSDTICSIRIKKPFLSPGGYIIGIGLWDQKMSECYYTDYESTGRINIISKSKIYTRFQFEHEWSINNMGKNIIWVSKENLFLTAKKYLLEVDILLDIGCGIRPQEISNPKIHICCEPFDEYVQVLQDKIKTMKNVTTIIKAYWNDIVEIFPSKSVDSIYLLDVIEHLEKNVGLKLLKKSEQICKKQLVLFTPLGFLPQHHEDGIDAWGLSGGHMQEHKSGWLPDDFDDSWIIIACKDFHTVKNENNEEETVYGAFFAIKNFNE